MFPGAGAVLDNVRACLVITDSPALVLIQVNCHFSNSFKLRFGLSDMLRCSLTFPGRGAFCDPFVWAWWDFAWKNALPGNGIIYKKLWSYKITLSLKFPYRWKINVSCGVHELIKIVQIRGSLLKSAFAAALCEI